MIARSIRRSIGLGLSTFLLFASMTAMADDCEKRIRDAQRNVDKQVQKHGERSRQAEDARHHLEDVRGSCHRGDRDRH